jgi:hypothetical protein
MGVPARRLIVPSSRSIAIDIARLEKLVLITPAAMIPATSTCL